MSTETELRCEAGQAEQPTPETCNRHPDHHWCKTCNGWYGVPHTGIHPHPADRQCACRPCRDHFAAQPSPSPVPSRYHATANAVNYQIAPGEFLTDALKRSLEQHKEDR